VVNQKETRRSGGNSRLEGEDFWGLVRAEFEKLREEILLRIQLQNNAMHYCVAATGALVAAFAVLLSQGHGSPLDLLSSSNTSTIAILMLAGYSVLLITLSMNYCHQTYMILRIDEYQRAVASNLNTHSKPFDEVFLLGWGKRRRIVGGFKDAVLAGFRILFFLPLKKRGRVALLDRLQPIPLFTLPVISSFVALILAVLRLRDSLTLFSVGALVISSFLVLAPVHVFVRMNAQCHGSDILTYDEPWDTAARDSSQQGSGEDRMV